MGGIQSRFTKDVVVTVKTGDVKGAGTNSNVYIVLIDAAGNRSPESILDCKWKDDFEKGSEDSFTLRNAGNLGRVVEIELRRDGHGLYDNWFVEFVHVMQKGECLPFPLHRWIQANRKYNFTLYDSMLPQDDPYPDQRKQEMDEKEELYKFAEDTGIPRKIISVPVEQQFTSDYQWDIGMLKMKLLAGKVFINIFEGNWDTLEDVDDVYKCSFGVPYGVVNWKSDANFGEQRFRGVAPNLIELCQEIPKNFAVTSEMVEPFLDGKSLTDALENKEIYIVDLKILEGIECKEDTTLCPAMALFHAKEDEKLMPIAIQLFQEPAPENPVFLPSDPTYTWMLAKMYFNNAESNLHENAVHLCLTHLVAESICVSVHRCLSPSHPVHRLLAPHFLFLLPINSMGLDKLLAEDGWINNNMTGGVVGGMAIMEKVWSTWRLNVEGWLPAELKKRGVDDMNLLPGYYYRNDGLKVHKAIWDYVREVVKIVYDTPEKLKEDYEVQELAKFLVDKKDGAGIKGVFGDGKFDDVEDLIKFVTSVISISTISHAAANFGQYDEYAFPPNYPSILKGGPPKDKTELTEADIIRQIPDKKQTLSVMVITKLLSSRATKFLGDFEVQYQYEPKALAAVSRFQSNLLRISEEITKRNKDLEVPYPYLDPKVLPNAISI